MDGNGRWAGQRHLPRVEGHRAGIDAVRDVVESSARLGLEVLTLYAFSVENWKRPAAEVSTLMMLLKRYLRLELVDAAAQQHPLQRDRPHRGALARRARQSCSTPSARRRRTPACCSTSRSTTAGAREIVDAARRAMESGVDPQDARRGALRRFPLHRRPARSRSADSHERRDARQQFPALADRLRGDLGHRHAVARLPLPPPARRRARLPETRPPLRRHHRRRSPPA